MDERFHGWEVSVEDWHWWYQVRRDILDDLLRSLHLPHDARLVDVGCGTGGASLVLSRYGAAVAVDRSGDALRLGGTAGRPYRHRVVAAVDQPLPFADATFDVVCALDILEHLDDDLGAAKELRRICKPSGVVIVFVPAFKILWGYNDAFSHHRRRYTSPQLDRVVSDAGLRVERSGYFNAVLFAPTLAARLVQRLLPRLTNGMEHAPGPSVANGLLRQVFRLELPLLKQGLKLPFGTSAFCIARPV